MAHILIVCTANICRSPLAEALLRKRLQERGVEDWSVSSAGTWALIKRGAAHNTVLIAQEYGLDISEHLARMVDESHLQEADLVLCMETGHMEALQVEFPDQAHKIYMLSHMTGKHGYSIDDPYGQGFTAFQLMAVELARLIDSGLDRIIDLAEENALSDAGQPTSPQ